MGIGNEIDENEIVGNNVFLERFEMTADAE
jgi:hypothetical protein